MQRSGVVESTVLTVRVIFVTHVSWLDVAEIMWGQNHHREFTASGETFWVQTNNSQSVFHTHCVKKTECFLCIHNVFLISLFYHILRFLEGRNRCFVWSDFLGIIHIFSRHLISGKES